MELYVICEKGELTTYNKVSYKKEEYDGEILEAIIKDASKYHIKEIYDYYRKTQKLHMDSKSVIEDCKQDLYVDWEGIKQGLKGGVCEVRAIEMEEKFRYNKK